MAELFPRESILSDSFTNHSTGNYLRHGINITTNRGCPQHSGETGTRLSSAIHKRLLSRYFPREGNARTQAIIYQRDMIQVIFFYLSSDGSSLMQLCHVLPGHSDASFKI